MVPTWQALIDGARYCEPQLREILRRHQPDVVVEDNVVAFPALMTCGAPFVRIVSCNPLEVGGPDVPPAYSGLPSDDASEWASFRAEYDRTHRPMWAQFNEFVQASGAPPLPDLRVRPHLRAREPVRVPGGRRLHRRGDRWTRPGTGWTPRCGPPTQPVELPADFLDRPEGSALVYLSLGSLGSADVDLMRRLVSVLAATPHRYVVSMGPQHAEYELADEHVGRGVPAADDAPAAGRPGDHPRRQQHDHRGVPLRQADGRAPAVLGPVRQRPAGARDRLRRAAGHLRLRRRRADRGDRPAARRHGAAAADGRARRSGSGPPTGAPRPPTSSSGSPARPAGEPTARPRRRGGRAGPRSGAAGAPGRRGGPAASAAAPGRRAAAGRRPVVRAGRRRRRCLARRPAPARRRRRAAGGRRGRRVRGTARGRRRRWGTRRARRRAAASRCTGWPHRRATRPDAASGRSPSTRPTTRSWSGTRSWSSGRCTCPWGRSGPRRCGCSATSPRSGSPGCRRPWAGSTGAARRTRAAARWSPS